MIIYTCPNCGEDLREIVLASYPPQYKVYCPKCNWENIEKRDEIVRVSYLQTPNLTINTDSNVPLACKGCSNHPNNGGSGICHCTLGTPTVYW